MQRTKKVVRMEQNHQSPLEASQPIADNWCHTLYESVKVSYRWTLHNFSFNEKLSDVNATSSEFSAEKTPDVKWVLNLSFNSAKILLQAKIINSNRPHYYTLPVRMKFAVVNKKRELVHQQEHTISAGNSFPTVSLVGKQELFGSSDLLVDGKFTVFCEIETNHLKKTTSGKGVFNIIDQTKFCCELNSQLEWLFENISASDVAIDVRGHKFQAHKVILSAKSPVFAAMFAHETTENVTHRVDVPDIEPEIFKDVLRFIYTSRATKIKERAIELFFAADKYLLDELKQQCQSHLINRMSAENCMELLLLPSHHPAEQFKKNALDFFRHDSARVMTTDMWKTMKEDHPSKLFEILEMVFNPIVLSSVVAPT